MKTMLIVDGNSILNRAFYGVKPLTTHDGLQTGAVYGMLTILSRHLEQLKPDYAACAFDLKAPTFRHLKYDGYKANRKGMPEELAQQLPYAKDAMTALGFTVTALEGYEADDILGTLSLQAAKEGVHAYVLTGDRDSLQLIGENVTVLLATNKETVPFTAEKFQEVYGIDSAQFVDVKAIMGDTSDNIPGVKGIGEKGALSLIAKFGSLDSVYENIEDPFLKPAMREKLKNDRENAYLSRFLATIDRHAPLPWTSLADFAYTGVKSDLMLPLCQRLEFTNLRHRMEELAQKLAPADRSAAQAPTSEVAAQEAIPVTVLTPSEAEHLPSRLTVLEAEDGMWFCDGNTVYSIPGAKALELPLLTDPNRQLCFADAKPFCEAFSGANQRLSLSFDLNLAAYVLHAREAGYDLSAIAQAWLRQDCPDTAAGQVALMWELWAILARELTETGTNSLYYDIELPLCDILAQMECRGFTVDCQGLREFSDYLAEQMQVYTDRIYATAGHVFNLNSPKQLGTVLFEELGLPAPKKTKTGYSTNAEVLESLRPFHPIVADILDYRQVMKLQSTYALGLLKCADEHGRVHTTFHQTKTLTGRLSSSEPNLQNIPIRTELGRQLRKYFVPRPGYLLVDADYSQIELRLLGDIAKDQAMQNAFRDGVDIHALTASQVFHVPMEEVSFEQRKQAKAVNFGIVYGISKFSLAEDLHISRPAAGEYIDRYFATYPGVQSYMKDIVDQAKANGYVPTLWGRRRYIPELTSSKAPLRAFGERVARNSPIQGTAADLIKLAMVKVHRALVAAGIDAHLILQVHDELIVEASVDCAAQAKAILQREMEDIPGLQTPMKAEAAIGENLLDSKN